VGRAALTMGRHVRVVFCAVQSKPELSCRRLNAVPMGQLPSGVCAHLAGAQTSVVQAMPSSAQASVLFGARTCWRALVVGADVSCRRSRCPLALASLVVPDACSCRGATRPRCKDFCRQCRRSCLPV